MSSDTYFKAVCLDGTDFHSGVVQWAPPAGHEGEWIVQHPTATEIGVDASEYLSVSTVATDCTGMGWPCRLLTVEAVGDVTTPSEDLPHKRGGTAFRVTGELPAHAALGPQGVRVAALIDRAWHLTPTEAHTLASARDTAWAAARDAAGVAAWAAARDAAGVAAWDAARVAAGVAARDAAGDAARDAAGVAARDAAGDAARDAARVAARVAAWAAARDAARALVVRDLISTDHYNTLTQPWASVIGKVHPDDHP